MQVENLVGIELSYIVCVMQVEDLVGIELSYVNTRHPDFKEAHSLINKIYADRIEVPVNQSMLLAAAGGDQRVCAAWLNLLSNTLNLSDIRCAHKLFECSAERSSTCFSTACLYEPLHPQAPPLQDAAASAQHQLQQQQMNGPRKARPGAVSAPPNQRVENLADDSKLHVGGSGGSNPGSGPGSPRIDHRFKGLNLLDDVVKRCSVT